MPASLERAAAGDAELAEHNGGGTEAGDAGLQHVQADEGGEPQPQRRMEMGQGQAQQDHGAGEGEDGSVEVHDRSPARRWKAGVWAGADAAPSRPMSR